METTSSAIVNIYHAEAALLHTLEGDGRVASSIVDIFADGTLFSSDGISACIVGPRPDEDEVDPLNMISGSPLTSYCQAQLKSIVAMAKKSKGDPAIRFTRENWEINGVDMPLSGTRQTPTNVSHRDKMLGMLSLSELAENLSATFDADVISESLKTHTTAIRGTKLNKRDGEIPLITTAFLATPAHANLVMLFSYTKKEFVLTYAAPVLLTPANKLFVKFAKGKDALI